MAIICASFPFDSDNICCHMKKYLDDLEATIQDRKNKDPKESYVAFLFEEKEKILSKIKEESEELAEAFRENDPSSIKHESADLLFHLMVLLSEKNIPFDEVLLELKKREGVSGHEEKKSRK